MGVGVLAWGVVGVEAGVGVLTGVTCPDVAALDGVGVTDEVTTLLLLTCVGAGACV